MQRKDGSTIDPFRDLELDDDSDSVDVFNEMLTNSRIDKNTFIYKTIDAPLNTPSTTSAGKLFGVGVLRTEEMMTDNELQYTNKTRSEMLQEYEKARKEEMFDLKSSAGSSRRAAANIERETLETFNAIKKRRMKEAGKIGSMECIGQNRMPKTLPMGRLRKKVRDSTESKRKRPRRRAINVDELHEMEKRFGLFVKAVVVMDQFGDHTESGDNKELRESDIALVQPLLNEAIVFERECEDLKNDVKTLCQNIFRSKGNEVLLNAIKAVEKSTEYHFRSTVRKKPSDTGIDAWTGKPLSQDPLKGKAGIIFKPENENIAFSSTILTPKYVPELISIIHCTFHLANYVKSYIAEGLKTINGLQNANVLKDIWITCAGPTLSQKEVYRWPKHKTSKVSNGFVLNVVYARELVTHALKTRDKLKEVWKDMPQSKSGQILEANNKTDAEIDNLF